MCIKNKKIFYFVLIQIVLMLSAFANAETIIYDNITTSQYKTLEINDISNIDYINNYPYNVYINNSYYGTFLKTERIFIPDNSEVIIQFIQPINTNLEKSYDVGKVYLTIGIMFFIGFGIVIILVIWFIRKIWRK